MKMHVFAACLALSIPLPALPAQSPASPAASEGVALEADLPEGLSTEEWSSIRAIYESERHAACATEEGFETYNHGLGWRMRFDERGATTSPDESDWTWGLELSRWGYAGQTRAIAESQALRAQGQRVSRDWEDTLTEWWVNDTRGLEHGFTVHAPPTASALGGDETLVFELDVRGGLQPEVITSQRGARFLTEDGVTVVTYDGLLAFDADGVDLQARMEVTGQRLRLIVQASNARYPITVDPLVQGAYLKASNTGTLDFFGSSVAISGDIVLVGAPGEDSAASGINGGPAAEADNSAQDSGAAYVFIRAGSLWSQQAYLKASNTGAGDEFGWAVAVSGNTVAVGSQRESSSATGVNPGPSAEADDSAWRSGAAYVFVLSGSTWSQQAYIKASNTGGYGGPGASGDHFGSAVAISGDTLAVGAWAEQSNAIGVNPGALAEADNSASDSGAAYVFARSGSAWSQQAYLKASNAETADQFGYSVGVSGNTVVVGAFYEASIATGVNPGPAAEADNFSIGAGAAYVFARLGSVWSQQAYLKASNTGSGDGFGYSVAVSEDTIVVGSPGESSSATGVNGGALAEADNSAYESGAAYVYARAGSAWSQQAYLKASNTSGSDLFGWCVTVSGDVLVVSSPEERGSAAGVDHGLAGNTGSGASSSGAAYLFARSGSVWSQSAYLKASNPDVLDRFGDAVSISADTVVVGAHQENGSGTGVNPGPAAEADNSTGNSGAVYVFEPPPSPLGTPICSPGVPNSTGLPARISAIGSDIALDNDVTFLATDLPPSVFALLATSPSLGTVIGAGGGAGTLCIASPFIGRHGVSQSNASGEVVFAIDLTAIPLPNSTTAVMAGDTRYWQLWYRDNGTSNFSDAVQIDFQ